MDRMLEVSVVVAALGFIGWLGGGRKWAFRTMLGAVVLATLGFAGVLLFSYATDRLTEHHTQKIHDCAIAKVATAKCSSTTPKDADLQKGTVVTTKSNKPWTDYSQHPNDAVWEVCPPYWVAADATAEQESQAIAAAEEACAEEIDPKQKSLHEQLVQYRRDHGVKEQSRPAIDYDALAKKHGGTTAMLSAKECAAKVRTFYPGEYDDLDDATLTKKVLAKYPDYCDVKKSPPDFVPDVKNIR